MKSRFKSLQRPPRVPDEVVARMYADYCKPLSLDAVARIHGNERRNIRQMFERRGLALRPPKGMPKINPKTGRFLAAKPLTERQLQGLIDCATKVRVPPELKLEWRSWSIKRRGEFIKRLRAKVNPRWQRPRLPFSKNLRPFDYSTPEAHRIAAQMNEGRDSKTWAIKIDACSQGVIHEGRLWFWVGKSGGYFTGPWTPERGRPPLHRIIWERGRGAVPPGHVIVMKDGNKNNLTLKNMRLATRDEMCRKNQAAALLRKSREMTNLLLNRNQKKDQNHENTDTLKEIRRRQPAAAFV